MRSGTGRFWTPKYESETVARLPTRLITTALLVAGASAVLLACPNSTCAQIEGVRPEVHLDLGFHADVGFGVRVDIPVVPEGLLLSAKDDLAISVGADLLFDDGRVWVGIPVALQWNFYVDRAWSLFPELGLALLAGHHHHDNHDDVGVDFLLAVGGRYHWSDRNALVLRIGWPIGIQFGVTF
jgi:hypothetical protein